MSKIALKGIILALVATIILLVLIIDGYEKHMDILDSLVDTCFKESGI